MGDVFGFGGESYDAVRVVRLGERVDFDSLVRIDSNILEISERYSHKITKEIIVRPKEADLLLGLWNALSNDEEARCHIPRHGFQLIEQGEPVFSVAVCFQCSNVSMGGRLALDDWRTFGAVSRQGQAFKMAFERLLVRARLPQPPRASNKMKPGI